MNAFKLSGLVLAAATLGACGGGNSAVDPVMPTPPVVSNEVPAAAYASTRAYASYLSSLPATATGEPLDVGKVVPPTSETEEPVNL